MLHKLADYAAMGILNTFVIDPRAEIFYRYESGDLQLCRETVVTLEGSAALVDWTGIAALRD